MVNFAKQLGMVAVTALLLIGCAAQVPGGAAPTAAPVVATPVVNEPAPTEEVVTPAPDSPVSSTITETQSITDSAPITAVEPVTPTEGEIQTGNAPIENIEIRILESFPVQVHAVVSGYLPDGCTTIASAEAVNEGSTFQIHVTTQRPADAICTMAIVEFEEVIPLNTTDLPAGTYDVVADGVSVSFDLP